MNIYENICDFIYSRQNVKTIMEIEEQNLIYENEFVLLIKPECFFKFEDNQKNIKEILAYIMNKLKHYNVNIVGSIIFNGKYAASRGIIENEYYILNKNARYGINHLATNNRQKIFRNYSDYIPIGAYGFLKLAPEYTAQSLELITETQLSDKIGNGTYVCPITYNNDKYAVINAFHPYQVEHFNSENNITLVLLCNTNTNYELLADSLVGFYSPEKAIEGSIRKYLYDRQTELGLYINNLYNAVHISPSPLEGILGFWRYSSVIRNDISKTYLGKALSNIIPYEKIEELVENPTINYNDKYMDLFEVCERKNALEIIKILENCVL